MDKFSFLHNPKTYTLSSMILGYILIGNLSSAEQNALGNYLITIGQILEENSAIEQAMDSKSTDTMFDYFIKHEIDIDKIKKILHELKIEIERIK